jgi:hypothetical protein
MEDLQTSDNNICYFYIGKYYNNYGNCKCDIIEFNKIIKILSSYLSQKFRTDIYKCYKYYDKELYVYKKNRIALIKNPIKCNIIDQLCMCTFDEYQIELEQFPIIEKYTHIYNVYKKIYTLKNIQQIEIVFENEKYEPVKLDINLIYIKFPIKYIDNAKKIIDILKSS